MCKISKSPLKIVKRLTNKPKRPRHEITVAMKQNIIDYHRQHPGLKHKEMMNF